MMIFSRFAADTCLMPFRRTSRVEPTIFRICRVRCGGISCLFAPRCSSAFWGVLFFRPRTLRHAFDFSSFFPLLIKRNCRPDTFGIVDLTFVSSDRPARGAELWVGLIIVFSKQNFPDDRFGFFLKFEHLLLSHWRPTRIVKRYPSELLFRCVGQKSRGVWERVKRRQETFPMSIWRTVIVFTSLEVLPIVRRPPLHTMG